MLEKLEIKSTSSKVKSACLLPTATSLKVSVNTSNMVSMLE